MSSEAGGAFFVRSGFSLHVWRFASIRLVLERAMTVFPGIPRSGWGVDLRRSWSRESDSKGVDSSEIIRPGRTRMRKSRGIGDFCVRYRILLVTSSWSTGGGRKRRRVHLCHPNRSSFVRRHLGIQDVLGQATTTTTITTTISHKRSLQHHHDHHPPNSHLTSQKNKHW